LGWVVCGVTLDSIGVYILHIRPGTVCKKVN
jgi:hypothetical protein